MDVDVRGRVLNTVLTYGRPLNPVFEAIVNSIHAIGPRKNGAGRIEVLVVRDESQQNLGEEVNLAPIDSFEITDNGVGFTDENFESFQTCDSRFKAGIGAKGIGRLLWLKAFSEAHVDSVFTKNGKLYRRTFAFRLTKDGVENPKLEEVKDGEVRTTVRLKTYQPKFQKFCPKRLETIALKTLDHCLVYLTQANCPRITVRDSAEALDLTSIYEEEMAPGRKSSTVTIKGRDFTVLNLKIRKPEEPRHRLYLCAQNRAVVEENLATHIPDIGKRLTDENGDTFFVSSYVSGEFLEEFVNPERTAFTLPDVTDLLQDEIGISEIRRAAVDSVRAFVAPQLQDVAREKKERIVQYVRTKQPRYRALIQHNPEVMDDIEPGLSEEKLEIELHKAKARIEADLKAECAKVLVEAASELDDLDRIAGRFSQLFEKVNAYGKAELADYIVHRKLVLDLLHKRLELGGSGKPGKHSLEEAVHSIIFPLRKTSDDVDFENQNLWIIDEKLAYHRYLASDKPLQTMGEVFDATGGLEPDLIIFENPFAITEGELDFSAIVIIEFKRPARDDYTDEENPVKQVYRYIDRIRAGKAKDGKGKPIEVPDSLSIYVFVIADITPNLKDVMRNYDFTKSADGKRYFGYNKSRMAYVEIISYQKIVSDATQRNRILFDKLQLPTKGI